MPDSGLLRRALLPAGFVLLFATTAYAGYLGAFQTVIPAGFALIFAAYSYAGYWGLAIRRGLAMGAYRAQALGISAIALYFWVIGIVNGALTVNAQSSGFPVLVNASTDTVYIGIIMYVINSTVSVSRRSDPFERNTLHYSATKYLWVAAVVILYALSFVYDPIGLVFTVAAPLSPPLLALAVAPLVITGTFGAVLLFLASSRSNDRTLRSHIGWLAAYALLQVMVFAVGALWRESGGNASIYGVIIGPLFIGGQTLAAYCLYKSAKSLAPIARTLGEPPSSGVQTPG